MLPDQPAQIAHRHRLRQQHHQRLEQQSEPRPRPRPSSLHLMHPVLGAPHPRHPRVQVGVELKKVQVPPRVLACVVWLELHRIPIWARELSALAIRKPDVQSLLVHRELDLAYRPWLFQPERCPEQFFLAQARHSLARRASGSPTSKPSAACFFYTWPISPLSPLETARSPQSSAARTPVS